MSGPKLRTGGVKEPYPLGEFPEGFAHIVAGELSAYMALGRTEIEGKDWEQIFAKAIKAQWKPSVMGLDDILVPELSAAWGAKTIKNAKPFSANSIRLISGRNSLDYSYNISNVREIDTAVVGAKVLEIWNERVASLYQKYKTVRTVVLLKGPDLRQITVFEKETVRYHANDYQWKWNKNDNLLGIDNEGSSKFTWQPHGAQFTIHEHVPDYALNIEIKSPSKIKTETILESIQFSEASYKIIPRLRS